MKKVLSMLAIASLSIASLNGDTTLMLPDLLIPSINNEATSGLANISSAEAMGKGRLSFTVSGSWYRQSKEYPTSPSLDADIVTAIGAASYGANSYIDLFASVGAFGSSNYTNTQKKGGWGSVKAGVQGTLPYRKDAVMHLGAQAALIGGTSNNQINNYRADGYNYFQTRTSTDFMAKLMQTLSFGSEANSIKLHLNEGAIQSISGNDMTLLLLGAGLQANILTYAILGLELNSRTEMAHLDFAKDPLWVTPTIQFRAFTKTNLSIGADISISKDRNEPEPRALEPVRIFGSVKFSFDTYSEKRNAEIERARHTRRVESDLVQEKADNANTEMENEALVRASDSAQIEADRLANKATEDSIALYSTTKSLDQAIEMRTEEEKRLLNEGLLTLDNVYFDVGKSEVQINAKQSLELVAKMLVKYPKLQLEVAGHSDISGSTAKNIKLAQARADAVRTYLIEVEPTLSTRLIAKGYGEGVSKESNKTIEGREANRRVKIIVLNKEVLNE